MPATDDTAAITARYSLPTGGTWYHNRDAAIDATEAGGFMVAVPLNTYHPPKPVYGIFPTQKAFCSSAKRFLANQCKREPGRPQKDPRLVALVSLLATHTPIPLKTCLDLSLPPDGEWFDNELGALTAYTVQKGSYMTKITHLTTTKPYYGVFATAQAWNAHRHDAFDWYDEQRLPFATSALNVEYDRCRCTLMRIKGALYKPPDVRVSELFIEELKEFCERSEIFLPRAGMKWVPDLATALRMGGHVLEWTILDRKLFTVSPSALICNNALNWFIEALYTLRHESKTDELLMSKKLHWRVAASCETYGFLDEDWNWNEDVQRIIKSIAEFERDREAAK